MKNERKERIVTAIRDYVDRKELSYNKLSTELGFISGPQLSNVNNPDNWHKISDAMWQRLAAKFLGGDWRIYETVNFRAIQRICADMQQDGEVTAIAEFTGAGKSVSAEAYANNTPNAFYLECNQLLTKKDFVREIQKVLGIYTEGRIVEMLEDITDYLTKLTNPLLIIDEADKLTDQNLLLLKIIYDRLEYRCGFVVMGTEVLRERIEKNSKRNKLGWRELKRRFFTNWKRLRKFDTNDPHVRTEVESICSDQGITNLEQLDIILKQASNYGEVRNMIRAFNRINAKAAEKVERQPELALA